MISKTQVEKMEHQIHILQRQLYKRDPYGEIRRLMDRIMELNNLKCQLQKQVERLSAQLERKETTMKTPTKKPNRITLNVLIKGHIISVPNCAVTYEWDPDSKSFLTRPTFETQQRIAKLNAP